MALRRQETMALLLLLGILYSTRLVLVEVHTTIPVVRLPCAREEDPREEYHVATTGVDTNPGSADAPFLTLRFSRSGVGAGALRGRISRCQPARRALTL